MNVYTGPAEGTRERRPSATDCKSGIGVDVDVDVVAAASPDEAGANVGGTAGVCETGAAGAAGVAGVV